MNPSEDTTVDDTAAGDPQPAEPLTPAQRRRATTIEPDELKALAAAVGDLIHAGKVDHHAGYQAIGAVAAWRVGFHDLAHADMDPALLRDVEAALDLAGVPVPWRERTPDPQASPTGGD